MEIQFAFNGAGEAATLRVGGVEFAAPNGASAIFLIQLRDFIGNELRLAPADFSECRRSVGSGVHRLEFSGCARLPETRVVVTVLECGAELRWRIEAHPGLDAFRVEWIDFPRIRMRKFNDCRILLPFAEGTLVEDPDDLRFGAEFRSAYAEYPMTGIGGFYPGPVPLQMEAYYTPDAGLRFTAEDPRHTPKCIDMKLDGEDAVIVLFQHFTGGEDSVAYDTVSAGFRGDWQTAAEAYRDWMERSDAGLPPKLAQSMPEWFADSPVLLIYPVRGRGLDTGGLAPNEYYPYTHALGVIARWRNAWKNPLMALLMHWEGTAPWAPPYVWPPYGGEEELRTFVGAMHDAGDRVGLYGSGIGWTQQSMIDPAYNCEERFESEQVGRAVCSGPHGERFSRVCNGPRGQRIGYDLCAGAAFTAKTVADEISSAARLGIDYLQYFDQNQGCAAPLCYSRTHGHAPLPGAWQTEAMRRLLDAAGRAAGETVLGCENAAAEPYLGVCRLNDLRNHLAWGFGTRPVPLYSYVFHEYVSGFSGNGVCLSEWVDCARTPFFLQWVLASNFAAGNLLSVVLKDGGAIHWNWALPWSVEPPAQPPLIELIGRLSEWRRGRAAQYLIAGRMERTPPIRCGSRRVFLKQRPSVELPAVVGAAWRSSGNGGRALILVNYGEKPEPCRVDLESSRRGVLISNGGERSVESASPLIEVPPLDAVLLEFPEERSVSPSPTPNERKRS